MLKSGDEMAPNTGKKAILAVSFGTSFTKTREKNIDRIEEDIREAFPDYRFYRAWTSKMIIAKLLRRDGIHIPTVEGGQLARCWQMELHRCLSSLLI